MKNQRTVLKKIQLTKIYQNTGFCHKVLENLDMYTEKELSNKLLKI